MNTTEFKILVVDDEQDILEFLTYNLKKEGYTVFSATNGKEALSVAKKQLPHLIILDVMMPEMDGIETCEELRTMPQFANTIVLFLTARSEDYSEIAGFRSGADDYIAKPIRPKVLMARIASHLKRFSNSAAPAAAMPTDDVIIDKDRHLVIIRGEQHNLPNKEFKLLALLASRPERVFTRDEIFNEIWGTDVIVGDRTIDVHIRKLRERLGDDYISTIKGIGYKFTGK